MTCWDSSEPLLLVHALLAFPFSLCFLPWPTQFWSFHSHLKLGQEKSYFMAAKLLEGFAFDCSRHYPWGSHDSEDDRPSFWKGRVRQAESLRQLPSSLV